MKAGIITFVNTINYGASLQALALQEALEKFGVQAEVVNYVNKAIEEKEKNKKKRGVKSMLKELVMGRGTKKKIEKFERFEKENIRSGMKLTGESAKEVNEAYDCFVTGSDQVWNMKITHRDWNYFLSFVTDNRKKISYAPSFGTGLIADDDKKYVSGLLGSFNCLSVREKSGADYIRELSGREAEVVVDPTLLLNRKQWLAKTKFKPDHDPYILVYFPHDKKLVFDFVSRLKKKTGLAVVYLSISPRVQQGVETIYDASPEEFLGWFENAEYVVTGSFHGTAFSLNLQKQFYYEPSDPTTRIGNLARICGVEHRSLDNPDALNNTIDYSDAGERLESERKKSLEWLKTAIESVSE